MLLKEAEDLNPGPWVMHSMNEYTISRCKSTFEIKNYFEEKIGKYIYSLLPNVKENTFEF